MTGGSRAPWWLWPLGLAVFLLAPSFVMASVDKAASSLEEYSAKWSDGTYEPSEPTDPYVAPCDTDAVLDALGMDVVQYQMDRDLYVDGVIGPQTGAALCAEEIPPPIVEGSS